MSSLQGMGFIITLPVRWLTFGIVWILPQPTSTGESSRANSFGPHPDSTEGASEEAPSRSSASPDTWIKRLLEGMLADSGTSV